MWTDYLIVPLLQRIDAKLDMLRDTQHRQSASLRRIEQMLAHIIEKLLPVPSKVELVPTKENPMHIVEFRCPAPSQGEGMKAEPLINVQDPVHLSAITKGLTIQLRDQFGNLFAGATAQTVTCPLTADDPGFAITQPAEDPFHCTAEVDAVLASSGKTVTLTVVLTYNDGSFGPFTAQLPVICDNPETPHPVKVEIAIA